MPATLIKTPYEISFTGNPMPFIFNISAGENLDTSTLIVRVLIEQIYQSNFFDEIYLQKLYPQQNGNVQLDVGTIISPYLDYFTPTPKLSKPVAASGQSKRYKVSFILQTGANFSASQDSPILFAAKGGLAYEAWHYKEFFTSIIALQKKPLLFSAAREMVQMDEVKFLYWMCPQDLANNQEVIYKIYFEDLTSLDVPHPVKVPGNKWGTYCVAAGFNQANLHGQVDLEQTPVRYSLRVQSTATSGVAKNGALQDVVIVNQGGSYTDGLYTNIPIDAPPGSGALATVLIEGNRFESVTITAEGSNYVTDTDFFILNGDIGGTGNGSNFKTGTVVTSEAEETITEIVAEYFFNIDHRNAYDPYDIIYRNSVGGLESLRLLGRMEIQAEYQRTAATRTVPPSYYAPNLLAQSSDQAVEEAGFSGSTQFFSREQCLKLRDLFLNKEAWQVLDNRLLPVVVQNNKTKFYSNKDSLLSVQVEFKNAFTNTFFTPGALMPLTRTCPAVERFTVSQVNKDTLQINYSLEIPYDQIEIEITAGGDIYLHYFSGNTGSILQNFVNPATTIPVNITLRARTICSRETNPESYGPYATITLAVIGNSLPVAVTDNINVPSGQVEGYTTPTSLLANDYDPDGDELEILSGTFTTLAGGFVYSISPTGIVTFPNKFYNYILDWLDYQIREVGGTEWVTGRAWINIGSGGAVYVRAIQRNVVETTGGDGVIRDGEVWLEYFSDPAGTVPVDVTGRSLTINAKNTKYAQTSNNPPSQNSVTTYAQAATGTKNKIYTGNLYTYHSPSLLKVWRDFAVLPGTGYTPI